MKKIIKIYNKIYNIVTDEFYNKSLLIDGIIFITIFIF